MEFDAARDDAVAVASARSSANNLQFASDTTIPEPHHLFFYRPDALPDSQPAMIEH